MTDEFNHSDPAPPDTGLSLTVEHNEAKVHISFNKPVMMLILTPQQARSMAIVILQNAEAASMRPPDSPIRIG